MFGSHSVPRAGAMTAWRLNGTRAHLCGCWCRDDARRSAARPCAMGSFGIDEPVQVDDRQSRCNTFIGTAEPESEETGVTGKISTQTNRTLSVPVHCKSANAGTLQAMQRHAAEQLNGETMQAVQITAPAIGGGHALWGGLRVDPLAPIFRAISAGAGRGEVYSAHVLPPLGLD